LARSARETIAGTKPTPSRMRQSTVVAAPGAIFRMMTAMT